LRIELLFGMASELLGLRRRDAQETFADAYRHSLNFGVDLRNNPLREKVAVRCLATSITQARY
jgi:hypothetical protein